MIQDTLSPQKHIQGIFASTYRTLANIRVALSYIDTNMMKKIITSMIRPEIEYAAVVWSPHIFLLFMYRLLQAREKKSLKKKSPVRCQSPKNSIRVGLKNGTSVLIPPS